MPTGLSDPDSLLEQLQNVNDRLLSLSAADIAGIGKAIELRGRLLSRAGNLLRTAVSPNMLRVYRDAFEKVVEAGDVAVHRLLSVRLEIGSKYQRLRRLNPGNAPEQSGITYEM
ncbi:MAG: hypothetical protein ACR2NN_13625 [Bryobacteraceae bacterium]